MNKRLRSFTSAAALAAILFCSISLVAQRATQPEQQEIPQPLQPPADEQLLLRLHGKGDQVYTCKSESAQFHWTLKASRRPALRPEGTIVRQAFRRPHLAVQ
jgi:hypothetical protein